MQENILYSFRRCPYAIRARWALISSGITVTIREINLRQKPDELIKSSAKGTVPVLITQDNQVLDESLEIMKWAIINSKNEEMITFNDCKSRQELNSLIKTNDEIFKFHLDRFKYSSRYKEVIKEEHRLKARDIIINLNNKISLSSNNWLLGDSQSLADWAIWPFIRQYRSINIPAFDEDIDLKVINKWLKYFLDHKNYGPVMRKINTWHPDTPKVFYP